MYDKAVQEKQVILLLEQLPKQTIVIWKFSVNFVFIREFSVHNVDWCS
jgi:hypothetical protein